MKKNYIIHVNGNMHFLKTTDETAKMKRFVTHKMGAAEHSKMSNLYTGLYVELEKVANVNAYKPTRREAIVWFGNAVCVTWEEAVWNEVAQAWVPGTQQAPENESVTTRPEQE